MFVHVFGYREVEARIVNEYHYIRIPGCDIFFTKRHILKDGGQVQQHRNEPHIGQFAIMLHQLSALRSHQVAAKKAELSLWVFFFQGFHEVRRMQIAARLANYQVIFHGGLKMED